MNPPPMKAEDADEPMAEDPTNEEEETPKENDPIANIDQDLHEFSPPKSGESKPSPEEDTEMRDVDNNATGNPPERQEKEPSPTTTTNSSDLDITWQDVLMGNITQSEGLLWIQLKATPPTMPIECWTPFLYNISDAIDEMVKEAIAQISFLEYIIVCRIASNIPSKHPNPFGCIIFVIENCFKTTHKAVVLKVEDDVLHYITEPDNMEELHLSSFDDHEELRDSGVFRPSKPYRPKHFGDFLALDRSEEKLTHVVKGFLMDDQEGKLVKMAPRRAGFLRP